MGKRKTTEEFINDAKRIHDNKYDYSKVMYSNTNTKVCIICPEHGEFWQTPHNHLKGKGCPKCANIKNGNVCRSCNDEFVKKSKKVHGDKYDYSKVMYTKNNIKVCIICPKHGEFWQVPSSHLKGYGCPSCAGRARKNTSIFIKEAQEIHKGKYIYDKCKYCGIKSKICIICPKHGEFWQMAENHLKGCGCPKCNASHLENDVKTILKENNIVFNEQKKFKWLGKQSLDFYLPNHNIAIECQGKQHFEPIEYFGGSEYLQYIMDNDKKKKQLCQEHKIQIIYYADYDYDFPYNVITDKNKIINEIYNNGK